MATKRRRRQVPRRRAEPQIVITDSRADRYWKWGGRLCLILVPIFGGLWWVFGWYNGVEGLKSTVGALGARVEAMWQGQTTLLEDQKKISETLKRIEAVSQ